MGEGAEGETCQQTPGKKKKQLLPAAHSPFPLLFFPLLFFRAIFFSDHLQNGCADPPSPLSILSPLLEPFSDFFPFREKEGYGGKKGWKGTEEATDVVISNFLFLLSFPRSLLTYPFFSFSSCCSSSLSLRKGTNQISTLLLLLLLFDHW